MAIITAVQRGPSIHVIGENGNVLFAVTGGTLVGYTSNSVSIKRGISVTTYNEKGSAISTITTGL